MEYPPDQYNIYEYNGYKVYRKKQGKGVRGRNPKHGFAKHNLIKIILSDKVSDELANELLKIIDQRTAPENKQQPDD